MGNTGTQDPQNGAVDIYSSARGGELPYAMGKVGQIPAKLLGPFNNYVTVIVEDCSTIM